MIMTGIKRTAAVATLAAVLSLSGCGQKATVVLEKPIRNVFKTESNVQTLIAWADEGAKAVVLVHIDGADDLASFPTSLHETMKNAADHLERGNPEVINRIATIIENGGTVNLGLKAGMYKRVIWVLPASGSVTDLPLDNFKNVLMTRRSIPAHELEDLAISGKHIVGSIAGVPLTVTSLADFEAPEESALLDIDLSYFVGLQATTSDYKQGTVSLLNFLREIKGKRINAVLATINRSSVNQSLPLDIRYFADGIEEFLKEPSMLEGPVPEKYSMMIQAEKSLTEGNFNEAASLYSGLVQEYPDMAGLHFSHAFALGFLDKGEECRDAMVRAYALDNAYLMGFFQLARVLGANGRLNAGDALLETPDLRKTLSDIEMEYQRGLYYMQAGLYMDAAKTLTGVATKKKKDFALRTVIYRAYEELGDNQKMYSVLEDLVNLDRDRVVRDMPWAFKKLGDIAWNHNINMLAADWYRQYLEIAPADPDSAILGERIEKVMIK
jgi:tetratricopeptide (TPR) repeat protein